jgi:alanine racemase
MTARAEIDLGAVRRNVARLAAVAPGATICAVVKADAYGHGVTEVAGAALEGGAGWLAVATPAEAVVLAEAGIDPATPILLLSEPDPDALRSAWASRPDGLRVTIGSADGVAVLAGLASETNRVPVHLQLDTGMHRMGAAPADGAVLADLVVARLGLVLEGVWTHFAVADDPEDDFTHRQILRFDDGVSGIRDAGHDGLLQHLCNSAGLLTRPDAHRDLVRVGIALYGVDPSPALAGRIELEPVLRLSATVTALRTVTPGESVSYGRRFFADRPTRVATIDIGYADGVRRSSAEAGIDVLVRGARAPMLGVVTMDQTMVAVGDDVALGDEAVLIGTQGGDTISVQEIAGRLGTIGYEVLTDLGGRITRSFRG